MKTERINLSHKEILFEPLKNIKLALSEYSFSNLYLFREIHQCEVLFDKEIFIKGKTYDGFTYIMPTKDIRGLDSSYLKQILMQGDFLYPIPEEWLESFNPDEFEFQYNDADSDYIYDIRKMATYSGNKLHKKRNLLKQFQRLYEHQAFPLTNERIDDAFKVLEAWQSESGLAPGENDYYPCLEALKKQDVLVICGGIYYVEHEPAAFFLGEEIKDDMFVICFAKACKKFKGIYQYMYNNIAKIFSEKYKYFNFEEDLGSQALKLAKSSYSPQTMLKKYRVSLRN